MAENTAKRFGRRIPSIYREENLLTSCSSSKKRHNPSPPFIGRKLVANITCEPHAPSSLFDPSICPHCLQNIKLPRQGNGQTLLVSTPNAHIDFADFRNRANAALKSEAEQDGYYQEVKALLLTWEDNDIGLKPSGTDSYILDETRQLMEVFKNTYHYDTEHYLIPSSDPTEELAKILIDNVTDLTRKNRAGKKVLFIVYYNGHGFYRNGKLIWSAHGAYDSQSPALSWYGLQFLLENARFDILLVLDCCNAAGSISSESTEGTMEVLAACGRESFAPGPGGASVPGSPFTHCLTRHLQEQASNPDGLLTMKLHHLLQQDRILDNQSPIHLPFKQNRGPIVLRPLLTGAETAQISKREQHAGTDPVTKVLVAVSFRGDVLPDVQEFVELFNAQRLKEVSNIGVVDADVRVEGAFASDSTLILFSIPFPLWARLQGIPGLSFVGYFKSRNLWKEADGTSPRCM